MNRDIYDEYNKLLNRTVALVYEAIWLLGHRDEFEEEVKGLNTDIKEIENNIYEVRGKVLEEIRAKVWGNRKKREQ